MTVTLCHLFPGGVLFAFLNGKGLQAAGPFRSRSLGPVSCPWHPQWLSSLLQDLGVTKVGHMKRILCGIKELSRSGPATEA